MIYHLADPPLFFFTADLLGSSKGDKDKAGESLSGRVGLINMDRILLP